LVALELLEDKKTHWKADDAGPAADPNMIGKNHCYPGENEAFQGRERSRHFTPTSSARASTLSSRGAMSAFDPLQTLLMRGSLFGWMSAI
jgi:hypothetical protein